MLTVVLATSTAALFGVADFLGGLASRRESAISVTAAAHGVGVLLFGIALAMLPAPFSMQAIYSGVAAGVAGGVGVASLYAALGRGRMSVIAPLTAAISGTLPAVYDFARGSVVPPTALAGLALALVATIVVSATAVSDEGDIDTPPSSVALAFVAGVGFAGSFISFSFAPVESGFWPLFAARVMSFGMLAIVALARHRTLNVAAEVRGATLGAGVLDTAANVTMVSAIRVGPLAVASVLGSLYPVFTVLLARIVLGEHLKGWQRLGVGLAFAAVLLAAWR